MTRKIKVSILITLILLICTIFSAQAQQEDYRLNVHRNFGFNSGSQIRGSFNLDIIGPKNIKSVTYLVDGQVISNVATTPFSLTFQTSTYATGWHDLSAVVETLDGNKINIAPRRYEFVSAEQESGFMVSFIAPLLGGVLLVMAIVIGVQMFFQKNKPANSLPMGASRTYGLAGGGVCPHCHRPFSLHWWAVNAGLRTKFDRCEYCGKWSLVRRLSSTELTAAEAAEIQLVQVGPTIATKSEDDRLKDMIDNSRYVDH